MHCDTPWAFVPVLPRGLALILILSLLLQICGCAATFLRLSLPPLSLTSSRWQKLDHRRWLTRRIVLQAELIGGAGLE